MGLYTFIINYNVRTISRHPSTDGSGFNEWRDGGGGKNTHCTTRNVNINMVVMMLTIKSLITQITHK